jgi:hypothetical protein
MEDLLARFRQRDILEKPICIFVSENAAIKTISKKPKASEGDAQK